MAQFIPPTLASEPVFHIGEFAVRNTHITSVFTLCVLLVIALILRKKQYQLIPSGVQNFMEILIGGLFDFFDQIVGDTEKTKKFFPLVTTIFLFVIVSNWMGLLPGFGSIGVWEEMGEEGMVLVPILRSTFADVNMTFALALISVTACQVFGFSMLGMKGYGGKFFINPLKNPVGSFVGLLELMSEGSKMISFSFRLFGNVFAGEVLLLVITFLVPYVAPLPFYGLEIFVGFIQALVFAFLTLVFLKIATTAHH
ncbi:ATP synthase F0 subunit A [Candidatus Peregrinibacteria bacterium CG_4_10_14_0_2_um_filter_38_24]|nr:MAG: ATP synthase F0 subunit A [Candidatus Peregrinibacteria bacterium CG_4_10_14_0_2_um_filter_38_24]PJC38895.1 MAG: ATP synthase F0 subunit A [Candidatus Peregrinibacteria bacterium CG_4_9_14_0_2_um_filter_38_9]